jgi:hypothetical protein
MAATMVRISYTYRGGCEELIVVSTYLPCDLDEPPPTKEMRDILDYCQSRKKQLIVGYHANALGTNNIENLVSNWHVDVSIGPQIHVFK